MTRVFRKPTAFLGAAACLFASLAAAQSFPGTPLNGKTLRVQNQAEEVYERADYERAFFIYRNELVPIGDKYGQYMVGFMYLAGKGVAEDRVTASAWYRLAAERGTKEFIQSRDQVMATLDATQRANSDRIFVELRQEYGDLVLLAKGIREDYEKLRGRTGSRLSATSSPLAIIDMNAGGVSRSGSDYYGRIERRIKARLEYIAKHTEIDIIDLGVENIDIDSIERQIAAHLSRID